MQISRWEACVVLCLSGPESELEFCGPTNDGGDRIDYSMARRYLAPSIDNPVASRGRTAPHRDAAQRWVRSPWGRQRITVVADALLLRGTLSSEQIYEVAAATAASGSPASH